MTRVLVAENIGESGIALLREHFDVTVKTDWQDGELAERDRRLRRDPDPLGVEADRRGDRRRAEPEGDRPRRRRRRQRRRPGRDQARHHRRQRAAVERRDRRRAHARAAARAGAQRPAGARGARRRALGPRQVLRRRAARQDARRDRLRPHRPARRRARAGLRHAAWSRYDPYVGAERYRELGVQQAASSDEVYAEADFITIHLPNTPETEGWLNAEAFAKMKDGVRVLNVARGPLIVDEDLQAALDSGKVAGAALDVFRSEPVTDHPLFAYPNVIVTPHLGASTAEATDRAGYQAAEQVVAALTGGSVTTAVNVPGRRRRGPRGARPVPAALPRARPARRRARRERLDRPRRGRVPRPARRPRLPPADDRGAARRPRRQDRGGRQRGQRAVDRRPSAESSRARRRARARATSPSSSA